MREQEEIQAVLHEMNETPDFFSDYGGTLVANRVAPSVQERTDNQLAHRDLREAQKMEPQGVLRIVKGQMEVQGDSTNLSGSVDRHASEGLTQRCERSATTQQQVASGTGLPPAQRFSGVTYEPHLDEARLSGQLKRVRDLMSDGRSRTLAQIAQEVGSSEASVSARLRDLRKPRFGLFTVHRHRIGKGLYCYQLGERGI